MKQKHDIHLHTYLSKCCNDKENQRPGKIVRIAEELGLEMIGFADHVWTNPDLKPNNFYKGQDERQIINLRKDLESIDTGLRILVGCEADTIVPGKFSITEKFAEELDYVLLSCNHLHINNLIAQPASSKARDISTHLLTMFCSGVESRFATSIVHSFIPFGFIDSFEKVIEETSDNEFLDAFGLAAANNVALEITVAYLSPYLKDQSCTEELTWSLDTPGRILSLAKKSGCKFTFGSDAHKLQDMTLLPKLSLLTDLADIEEKDILKL